jgi:hypothetical protein
MTVSPIPLPDALCIASDQHTLLHPWAIIHLLYPPLEHGMPHEPLEVHVKPVTSHNHVQYQERYHEQNEPPHLGAAANTATS